MQFFEYIFGPFYKFTEQLFRFTGNFRITVFTVCDEINLPAERYLMTIMTGIACLIERLSVLLPETKSQCYAWPLGRTTLIFFSEALHLEYPH